MSTVASKPWRTDIPLWEQGVMAESFSWMKCANPPSKREFFKRVEDLIQSAKKSSAVYMRLSRKADPARYQAQLRASYAKCSEQRKRDARLQREKLKRDPIKYALHKQAHNELRAKRRKKDATYKLQTQLRTRIFMALRGYKKADRTAVLIGCSLDHARTHIESLWKPGMTWANWGVHGWHIDHKRPCSSFDLSDPEQQKACFHYTNLQPLWWRENLSKGARQ